MKAFLHDSNTPILRDLQVNSQTLERISDAFSRMLAKQEIKVHSFWEELGLTNIVGIRRVGLLKHLRVKTESNKSGR